MLVRIIVYNGLTQHNAEHFW